MLNLGPMIEKYVLDDNMPDVMTGMRMTNTLAWEWNQGCFHYATMARPSNPTSVYGAVLREMGICDMDDDLCVETVGRYPIIQNTFTFWKKSDVAMKLVIEWLEATIQPWVVQNFPLIDQSILQILTHKHANKTATVSRVNDMIDKSMNFQFAAPALEPKYGSLFVPSFYASFWLESNGPALVNGNWLKHVNVFMDHWQHPLTHFVQPGQRYDYDVPGDDESNSLGN